VSVQQSKYRDAIRRADIHMTVRDHRRDELVACAERVARTGAGKRDATLLQTGFWSCPSRLP
ncbi:MAG: hypothetical protein QOG58_3511, partial [Caballeronia sp.]|nr:hypothetical protein [Caballeronia sp.]